MGTTTRDLRNATDDVKEGLRDLDGHQPIDDVRNVGDRVKTGIDNTVDRAGEVIDDIADKARDDEDDDRAPRPLDTDDPARHPEREWPRADGTPV